MLKKIKPLNFQIYFFDPLLFIIFINNLPNCCPHGNIRIFANDTNIFFHFNDTNDLFSIGKIIMTALEFDLRIVYPANFK